MTNSGQIPEPGDRQDDLLRRLILLLDERGEDQSSRPSEQALEAFLTGTATGEQEVQVLEALEKSRRYRKEVADIASDLASLRKRTASQSLASESAELPESIRKHIEELPSGKIYRIRGITSFLAAAILIITAVALFFPRGQEFDLLSESIERNTLIGLHSRGTSDQPPRVYSSGKEAALAAFRQVLVYDNAEFQPRLSQPEAASATQGERYSVAFDYPFTQTDISYDIALAATMAPPSVAQFYLLTLPSRNLYKLNADKESISARWNMGHAEYVCLTLVYPTAGGFAATPARVFSTQ